MVRLPRPSERKLKYHPVMRDIRGDPPPLSAYQPDQAVAGIVRSVRDTFNSALPVIRASLSSDPGPDYVTSERGIYAG